MKLTETHREEISCCMKHKWVFFIHHSSTLRCQQFNVAKNYTPFMLGNEMIADCTSCIISAETNCLTDNIPEAPACCVISHCGQEKMVNWDTLSEISHIWSSHPFVSCLPPLKMSALSCQLCINLISSPPSLLSFSLSILTKKPLCPQLLTHCLPFSQ